MLKEQISADERILLFWIASEKETVRSRDSLSFMEQAITLFAGEKLRLPKVKGAFGDNANRKFFFEALPFLLFVCPPRDKAFPPESEFIPVPLVSTETFVLTKTGKAGILKPGFLIWGK